MTGFTWKNLGYGGDGTFHKALSIRLGDASVRLAQLGDQEWFHCFQAPPSPGTGRIILHPRSFIEAGEIRIPQAYSYVHYHQDGRAFFRDCRPRLMAVVFNRLLKRPKMGRV